MSGSATRNALLVTALLTIVITTPAHTQRRTEALAVEGYSGEASVIRFQGREYVDVEQLARITNGSLRFERDRVILTFETVPAAGDEANKRGFSRPFMSAAVEAMASMREWAGMLLITVQNGYPVGNNMAGNTIMAYQARAAESIALASTAASTDSDYRGLELLKNEFSNAQSWADTYVKARNSMNAATLMSERGLKDDEEAQKILRCGQFLAQMFASGTFQDDVVCR